MKWQKKSKIWENETERTVDGNTFLFIYLTFVFPCFASIIVNDDQQDANILASLFLISSTCFGRCLRPSSGALDCIYIIWYCAPILLLGSVMDDISISSTKPAGSNVGGHCATTMFHLTHDTSRQQPRWTLPESVNTVACSWWWAKTSLETCTAD